MQIYTQACGAIRVLISEAELSRLGADLASLRARRPRADAAIRRILQLVWNKTDMQPPFTVTVRATPTDKGCLLLVTPRPTPPQNDGVHVFTLPDTQAAAALSAALATRTTEVASASLFRYHGALRLLLYCDRLSAVTARLIGEFARPHTGGRLVAARITEYGTPLFIGTALEGMQRLH